MKSMRLTKLQGCQSRFDLPFQLHGLLVGFFVLWRPQLWFKFFVPGA